MNQLLVIVAAALLSSSVVACTNATAPESTDQNSSAVRAHEQAADITGTWVFDLDSSDVAAPIRKDCADKSGGDKAKETACWNEIATEAKLEKVRFSKDANGHGLWTSFASPPSEGSAKEIVYVAVPVSLQADGPGHVLAKVDGKPTGRHADQFAKASVNALRIEVVDAKTIAMTDPKKGRLVYSKE